MIPAASALDAFLADASFTERHTRLVEAPIDEVWPAVLEVTASEIRAFAPLVALRQLPAVLATAGRRSERSGDKPTPTPVPFLDEFLAEGFVFVQRDAEAVDGRAGVLFGAAGQFWRPIGGDTVPFADPADLLTFDEPGFAVVGATIEAIDLGGTTELITETRVRGTDRRSTRAFAPYWALIRYPSGLIRRSWLAAIARRATRAAT